MLRAEDEQHFCYHVPFREASITVRVSAGDDTFTREDFLPVRRFLLTVAGSPVHPSAIVLVVEVEGRLSIVALGRPAHVGAEAGPMQARYLTGRKSASMRESDSHLVLGLSRKLGIEGEQWQAYGELMSVDSSLVPRAVSVRRLEAAPGAGRLLVLAETGVPRSRIVQTYGDPQRSELIQTVSPGLRVVQAAGPGSGAVYPQVQVDHYGQFAVASDPVSGQVVGFLFASP